MPEGSSLMSREELVVLGRRVVKSFLVLALVNACLAIVAGLFTSILVTVAATPGMLLGSLIVHFGSAAREDSWPAAMLVGACSSVSAVLIVNAVYLGAEPVPQPIDTGPLLAMLGVFAFIGGIAGARQSRRAQP
jgi:hypothetical protein